MILTKSDQSIILDCNWTELRKISSALIELGEYYARNDKNKINSYSNFIFNLEYIDEEANKFYLEIKKIESKYPINKLVGIGLKSAYLQEVQNEKTKLVLNVDEIKLVYLALHELLINVDNFELHTITGFNREEFKTFIKEMEIQMTKNKINYSCWPNWRK